jgi:hypothetical protein
MNILAIIHALLGLLAIPFISLMMAGCLQADMDGEPPDLGPEFSSDAVLDALELPLQNQDPFAIQLGEFKYFSISQDLGAGQSRSVMMDTGITIVEKTVESTRVLLTAIVHEFTYDQYGNPSKVSREIPLCLAKVENGCGAAEESAREQSQPVMKLARLKAQLEAQSAGEKAVPLSRDYALSSQAVKVTYHRLKTSMEVTDPPPLVKARPDCGGIAQCKIRNYKVSFSEVYWTDGKPDPLIYELSMSPDVPYLSGQMETCQTVLAPIGDSGHKVLLKQCETVKDFRFKAN